MAPTSDERREVAARLRERPVARNINEAYVAIVQAIGVRPCLLSHEGESGDRFNAAAYADALEKLADLIDPTCEVVGDNPYTSDYVFVCKTCHEHFSVASTPRYCPGCGRRIDYGNR